MGIDLLNAAKAILPNSGLPQTSRAALAWLAEAAQDNSRLTWLAQPTLAGLIGCTDSYVGKALAPLLAAGHLSVWKREGRGRVYFVHPGGLPGAAPINRDAARDHLRKWRRGSAADTSTVLAWLDDIGAFTPRLAAGVNAPDPCTQSKGKRAPQTPPHSVEGHPLTQSKGTPSLSRTEPEENQNRTRRAAPRPAETGGLAGDGAEQMPANISRTDALDRANKARVIGDTAGERKWNSIAARLVSPCPDTRPHPSRERPNRERQAA